MPESVRIKDLPPSERPRERLRAKGAEALATEELIAILLRAGTAGVSALDAARQLFKQFGTLDALARAKVEQLAAIRGIGLDKAVTLKAAFTLAQRLARETHGTAPHLETPQQVADFLREDCRLREVEHFQVLLLNTRRRLIRIEPVSVSQGTLDTLLVHPREVFKAAIAANAAAIVLAHNHPSGDPTPSEADIRVTRDLIRAGQLLKIEVVDHIIIGRRTADRDRDYVSLRELGCWAGC
jgi:DNA repair protein RadC